MLPLIAKCWNCDLPQNEMLVLQCLAAFADNDGQNAHPCIRTIARLTGYSYRQTQRILKSLEQQHCIYPQYNPGKFTTYHLTPESAAQKPEPPKRTHDITVSYVPISTIKAEATPPLNIPAIREHRNYGPTFPDIDDPAVRIY